MIRYKRSVPSESLNSKIYSKIAIPLLKKQEKSSISMELTILTNLIFSFIYHKSNNWSTNIFQVKKPMFA